MRINKKTNSAVMEKEVRLAGGFGARAAIQSDEAELRRIVMSCLLWEDIAYSSGMQVAKNIAELIPKIDPRTVANIAIETRSQQKLRHVPLYIVREMCKYDSHKKYVREVIRKVCTRPDQLTELVAIYWATNEKKSLPKQMKLGISDAFVNFDRYQISKWNRDADVKLRDVMFLCHPYPQNKEQESLFKDLADGTLTSPDTWEVGLSACKTVDEKRDLWIRLIEEDKLGCLALLRNLRNMQEVNVPKSHIKKALKQANPSMSLPIDFLKAADYAPGYNKEIEDLMFRCLDKYPKLLGETIFVLDVSGSMYCPISSRSQYSRMDVGKVMTILAKEMCESCTVYITAGSDYSRVHKTTEIKNLRGFGLKSEIERSTIKVGHGGIFTRQCLEYIREKESEIPDRIIVFSDSQDCDHNTKKVPNAFGRRNYIIDVSSHSHGVNYKGVWDAEISGWSEHFLSFIYEYENSNN